MGILRKQSSMGYTKIDEWDPEERLQRRAQFLIYKTLQKADHIGKQSQSSCLIPFRFSKLKIRVGRRLIRLRRGVVLSLSRARTRLSKQISSRFQALGRRLPTPLVA